MRAPSLAQATAAGLFTRPRFSPSNEAKRSPMHNSALSKVPAVTLGFWAIKILATTLGETGGDTVTMTWLGETTSDANPNGYLIGTGIFFLVLLALVTVQVIAKRFHPFLYWATI